ncbi:serine/threonine protein kinase [Streptomyces laurentii]|uniref:serine/threonine protein kinase n=1 Tax=Streptomyces laurentii TaxID=39478 RepID=UPI0033E4035D
MKPLADADPVTVGRYRTIAELGQGGMGRVLLSSAPDGQLVALKQVRTQFVEDDGFRARFRREVEASRKVSGQYTPTIIDADADAPEPWLTSVFVPGLSLQQVVAAVGALPEEPVLRMARGLASALATIHRTGLVHRDLKPSNVLLAVDGPRVIDFGIARAADSEDGNTLTTTSLLVGSPGFMSPEQARGEPVEAASDIFSLGAVLFMACTGEGPFVGPALPQTLFNIVHTEPDLGRLPARIRPIAAGCLAKDPADRPSADQLLEDIGRLTPAARPWPLEVHELIAEQQAEIDRLREELGRRAVVPEPAAVVVDKPPSPPGPPATPMPPMNPAQPVPLPVPDRRRRLVGAGIALGLVAAVGVALFVSGPDGGTGTIAHPGVTATVAPQPTDAPPAEPTVEPATEAPPRTTPAPTPPVESSPVTEPSRRPPASEPPRQSTRPAAIADCAGTYLARPESFILHCGDGNGRLSGLVWTDWGEPTAQARGQEMVVICEPNCGNGRMVRHPATVILSGLVGGRYTIMRVDTPRSPYGPIALYSLEEQGPTQRN